MNSPSSKRWTGGASRKAVRTSGGLAFAQQRAIQNYARSLQLGEMSP
jgi:hypothetical protein